jgi:hypothetical protein
MLLTDRRELAPHVYYHDDRHGQRQNVRKSGRPFEYYCVCQLNRAGVAIALNAIRASQRRRRAHERAQGKRCFGAYLVETTEAHLDYACDSVWRGGGVGHRLSGRSFVSEWKQFLDPRMAF